MRPAGLREHVWENTTYLVPAYWKSVQAAGGVSSAVEATCEISGQPLAGDTPIFWDIDHGLPTERHVSRVAARQAYLATVRAEDRPRPLERDNAPEVIRKPADPRPVPTKCWQVARPGMQPLATVGYGQVSSPGRGRGVRLELAYFYGPFVEKHKDRVVITKGLAPEVAVELGRALMEAGEQAQQGQAPATKRSDG